MKALLASGGRGTRLRPITHTQNKHLIPIANKPILHYAMEAIAAAGLEEVGIVYNADSQRSRETLAMVPDGDFRSRMFLRRAREVWRRSFCLESISSATMTLFSISATIWSSEVSRDSSKNSKEGNPIVC